jgi:hypothetical protein
MPDQDLSAPSKYHPNLIDYLGMLLINIPNQKSFGKIEKIKDVGKDRIDYRVPQR